MQFKVSEPGVGSAGISWKLNLTVPGAGRLKIEPAFDLGVDLGELGPLAGQDNTGATLLFDTVPVDFPTEQWVNLEVYFKQSTAFDGHIIIWQTIAGQLPVEIFNLSGIKTRPAGNYVNTWSVNHYGNGCSPSTSSLYVDDVAVGTGRMLRRV